MASVLIGNSCQTQTLQGLGRMGVRDIRINSTTSLCARRNFHVFSPIQVPKSYIDTLMLWGLNVKLYHLPWFVFPELLVQDCLLALKVCPVVSIVRLLCNARCLDGAFLRCCCCLASRVPLPDNTPKKKMLQLVCV